MFKLFIIKEHVTILDTSDIEKSRQEYPYFDLTVAKFAEGEFLVFKSS